MPAEQAELSPDCRPEIRSHAGHARLLEIPGVPSDVAIAENVELGVLVARVAASDASALQLLYKLTAGKMFNLARFILRNDADAEEVVSDVFVLVWQAAHRYTSKRGTVLGWMLAICRSQSIDRYRSVRRCKIYLDAGELSAGDSIFTQSVADELLLSSQQLARVSEALARLSPMRRWLLFLSFFRGLSHEEIAREIGVPLGTAKSHIRRTLKSLRCSLERPQQAN